ncbi:hypothetical protein COO60DRAFT_70944 [Scenedesmus sp. NREL 46B-D3]|nr:hypothetical protein COO60DRAFT_70944 [Scenedesmus sp. NREL 46B-D3]
MQQHTLENQTTASTQHADRGLHCKRVQVLLLQLVAPPRAGCPPCPARHLPAGVSSHIRSLTRPRQPLQPMHICSPKRGPPQPCNCSLGNECVCGRAYWMRPQPATLTDAQVGAAAQQPQTAPQQATHAQMRTHVACHGRNLPRHPCSTTRRPSTPHKHPTRLPRARATETQPPRVAHSSRGCEKMRHTCRQVMPRDTATSAPVSM